MTETKAHPFELSGMGTGPYRFVGIVSLPSSSLAEANPDAYNGALRECAEIAGKVSNGLGSCRHCGTAIMHNCIVTDAQGIRYSVGSDCVIKTDDQCLGDKVKVELARMTKAANRVKRQRVEEARRAKWLATVCNDRGETNSQRLEREGVERIEREAFEAKAREVAGAQYAWLADVIAGHSRQEGDFCHNISRQIRNGRLPSGRGLSITADIYAKHFGRYDSKAYNAAIEEFETKLDVTA